MKKFFLAALISIAAFSGSMATPVNHVDASNKGSFYQAKKKSAKTHHKKHHSKKKTTVKKK